MLFLIFYFISFFFFFVHFLNLLIVVFNSFCSLLASLLFTLLAVHTCYLSLTIRGDRAREKIEQIQNERSRIYRASRGNNVRCVCDSFDLSLRSTSTLLQYSYRLTTSLSTLFLLSIIYSISIFYKFLFSSLPLSSILTLSFHLSPTNTE